MKNTRLTCWEIPPERLAMLYWCRAVAIEPEGWRALWARFIQVAGWARYVLVTGYLITQWTAISPVSGRAVTTCVYDTDYGHVQVVVSGFVCAATRRLDVE